MTYHAATSHKQLQGAQRVVRGSEKVKGWGGEGEEATEVRGEWRFDYAAYLASNQQLTSNVLDLVRQLINRLSPVAQRLLSLAACIGTQFDADSLAVVSEMRYDLRTPCGALSTTSQVRSLRPPLTRLLLCSD